MKFSLVLALAVVAASVRAQMSADTDFVLAGNVAYGMLPPEPMASNFVRKVIWSPSGNYLVILRERLINAEAIYRNLGPRPGEDPREAALMLYDVAAHRSTVLWQGRPSVAELSDFQWMSGTDVGLAFIDEHMRTEDPARPNPSKISVVRIDARSASMRPIYSSLRQGGYPNFEIKPSPLRPLALLVTESQLDKPVRADPITGNPGFDWLCGYRIIDAAGAVSAPVQLDPGVLVDDWAADGVTMVLRKRTRIDGKTRSIDLLLNLATGITSEAKAAIPPFAPKVPPGPFTFGGARNSVKLASRSQDVIAVSLKSAAGEPSEALIGGDVSWAEVSPAKNAVAYITQGVAMIRPLVQVPKELYLQALRAAQRTKTMSNAKQLATALIMYALDWDDKLPSNKEDVNILIEPYLKNKSFFDGFVYSFGGGAMGDIKDPASTEMGYVTGPGGRAIIFADGHVKWRPDN